MNVFSLSFLDAMTCGFGAVILFFMIINANIDLRREDTLVDLSSEVDRMELQGAHRTQKPRPDEGGPGFG